MTERDGIGGTNGVQDRIVECPRCSRCVNLSPLSADVCYDKDCGLVFKVQKSDNPIPETAVSGQPVSMSMREQMARAIYGVIVISKMMPWDDLLPHHRELFLEQADAALDTLSNPTPSMIAAGEDAGWPGIEYTDPKNTIQAMVRAAKEGK